MASRRDQKEQLRAERLRQEAAERRTAQRRRLVQYGSAAAFLAICAVAVLIIVSQSGDGGSPSDVSAADASAVDQELNGIPQHDTVLGDPSAKVTVIEYGDLQCPVCKAFSSTVAPDLISGPVKDGTADYEFRQFIVIGPQSVDAAKAALAAGEQGRYWNFIQVFYRNQGEENSGYVTDSFLESVAKGAGVRDIAKWNTDRQSAKWDPVLSKVQSDARSLGLNATPSIVVEGPGGRRVVGSGVLPLSQIEDAIKQVE
jgi:protein-disulfide isomerase